MLLLVKGIYFKGTATSVCPTVAEKGAFLLCLITFRSVTLSSVIVIRIMLIVHVDPDSNLKSGSTR